MCMALKVDLSSVCCVANPLSFNRRRQKESFQLSLSGKQCNELHRCSHKLGNAEVSLYHCIDSRTKLRGKFPVRESVLFAATESFYHCIDSPIKLREKFPVRESVLFATTEEQPQLTDAEPNALELEDLDPYAEALSSTSDSQDSIQGANGKPGFISFYNCPYKMDDEVNISSLERKQNNLSWFLGPAVLVASFIFPSLYLRKILSTVFEDSLLTDFLILFFTEALFYCGVAVFLLLIDRLRRPSELKYDVLHRTPTLQLGQRISSVAALILSLLIPMVTMGLVWPWTGPAASATLAPYLVGIVVQFAFERYARYCKSPSWPVIPVVFQVYRLHQLNRAAQLVTALSFTVKGAEMTTHNLEISNSLNTLLSVLQILGVICIWSLSSFLMKVFHVDNNC